LEFTSCYNATWFRWTIRPNPPPNTPPLLLTEGRDVLYLIFDIITLALKHTYTYSTMMENGLDDVHQEGP